MDLEIFKTKDERDAAVTALEHFAELPGWKLIEKVLNMNIEAFDDKLRESDFASLEELALTQKRRSDLYKFKELPKLILDEARNVPPDDQDDNEF